MWSQTLLPTIQHVSNTKSGGHDEVSKILFHEAKPGDTIYDNGRNTTHANTTNSSLNSMETEMDQNLILPGLRSRKIERLDYKKLYDVCPQPSSMHIWLDFYMFIWLDVCPQPSSMLP
jgi:hypothetical protein